MKTALRRSSARDTINESVFLTIMMFGMVYGLSLFG